MVPAVAAVKSSSRNYHDYNFSLEEEVADLSNVSCRKGKKGDEIFYLMDSNCDDDNLSVEPKDEITYLMLQTENALHKRTNASGKTFAPDLLVRVLECLIEKREVIAVYVEKFGGRIQTTSLFSLVQQYQIQSLRQETRTRRLL